MGRGGEWEGAELGKVGSTSRLSLRENMLYTQLGFTHGPARHILLCHRVPTPGMDVSLLDMTVLQGVVTHTVPCRPRTALFFTAEGWK